MASHFVRWTRTQNKVNVHRIPQNMVENANNFNEKYRGRYLAARMLLAELMLHIYGIHQLPALIISDTGRPCFADPDLPDFSITYAGNVVGVLLAEENVRVGLDMEIVRAHSRQTLEYYRQHFSSSEKTWINAQQDPTEAATQLWTLRQSILKLSDASTPGIDSLWLHPALGRLRSALFPDIRAICDVEPSLVWSAAFSPGVNRLRLWEIDDRYAWQKLRDVDINKTNSGPHILRLTSMPSER